MSLNSSLSQIGSVNTGRLKWVAGALAGGVYTGLRELQTGWLLCNGVQLSNSGRYAALYAMVGTKFGAAGTLPNFVDGIVPLPKGTNWSLGSIGGEMTHQLSQAEMPSHNHTLIDKEDIGASGSGGYFPPWRPVDAAFAYPGINRNTNSTGGDAAHNNMPPYGIVGCILVKL